MYPGYNDFMCIHKYRPTCIIVLVGVIIRSLNRFKSIKTLCDELSEQKLKYYRELDESPALNSSRTHVEKTN